MRFSALLALLCTTCKCNDTSTDAPPPPKAGATVNAPLPDLTRPAGLPPACSALGVTGEARFGDRAIENGMRVDGSHFIELREGARLTLKYDLTGREVTLTGPALAQGCQPSDTVLALSHGTLESARGAGTRPATQGILATAAMALSYGDAQIRIRATGRDTTVEVLQGEARLVGDDDRPERPVLPNQPALKLAAKPDSTELFAACERYSQAAAESARRILDRTATDGGGIGQRAAEHVRTRKVARLRCAMASAAAGNMKDGDREPALDKLAAYDALWRDAVRALTVPSARR